MHLRAPEYLSFHLERTELKLRRLGPQGYEEVPPEPNGRVRSQELQLEFGMEETGFLRVYTLDGTKLPNAEELKQQLSDQEQRRGEAEARAAEEAQRRQEAEAFAAEEARQRQAEAQRRQEAEARAAEEARQREELERQVAALRARLQERGE